MRCDVGMGGLWWLQMLSMTQTNWAWGAQSPTNPIFISFRVFWQGVVTVRLRASCVIRC